jgi:hypothetical protein
VCLWEKVWADELPVVEKAFPSMKINSPAGSNLKTALLT